jgi:hypothetical protein
MKNEHRANQALAASRAIDGRAAQARAAAREARRSTPRYTVGDALLPLFILAATVYAVACFL